ncbi:MAG: ester cyclase [Lachnospiraceae bacterium]|nr:ester cyclase [Lachnospiraceae bacterium]
MTDKELVLKFIDEVFNAHDLTKLNEFMREDYRQHSVGAEDGRAGFRKFAVEFFKSEPYMDVKQVFESDDHTVAVFFKCSFKNGSAAKVVDMYRIEDGKLAEHWDVVQALPADDAKVNGRGSF